LAAVLRASLATPNPGAIYTVADDEPAPQADVVAFACRLLHRAVPRAVPLAEAGLSPLARSFYDDNKRVANRRIKDELGVRLRYPTYREGLAAILSAPAPGS
jgi:nucleoside-diphosphate-sugar epimerase